MNYQMVQKFLVSLSILNPEKYFTKEVLGKIDEYTKQKFTYGTRRRVKDMSLYKEIKIFLASN